MSVFALGDLHLSFCPDVEKPMDVFGPRWHDHAQRLKGSWLSTVEEKDTVVIAGDISWGIRLEEARYDLDWIHDLPGNKILLKGNHDLWWNGINMLNSMYDDMRFLQYTCVDAEDVLICGSRGWITPDHEDYGPDDEKIYKRELIRLEMSLEAGKKAMEEDPDIREIIGVLHYPPFSDARVGSGFHELFRYYGVRNVYYGHLHGEEAFISAPQGHIEGIEYGLVSLDYLNCSLRKIW